MREIEERGFSIGAPIRLTSAEGELFGNAMFVDPAQPLMHYMPIDRFRSLLKNNAVYMRRLDLFEADPLEGKLPAANEVETPNFTAAVQQQLGISSEFLKNRRQLINGLLRELTYTHCWFGSDVEDANMWTQYGDHAAGVCIKTTAERLLAAVTSTSDLSVQIHGVTYSDEQTPISEIVSFVPSCRKQLRFRDEREFRLLASISVTASEKYSTDAGIKTPEFQLVPVNFNRLFQAVLVGHKASDSNFAEVEQAANAAAGSRVVRHSEMPIS